MQVNSCTPILQSAIIVCDSPSMLVFCRGLPNKDPEEKERHKQEYEAMVMAAKKKGTVTHNDGHPWCHL